MMRRTAVSLGLFLTLKEELGKAVHVWKYDADQALNTLKGHDGETEESKEKMEKKRQAMADYMRAPNSGAKKAAADAAKSNEETAQKEAEKSMFAKLQQAAAEAKETLAAATSSQAGVLMLVQHCAAAHAAEVAVEQGIDVKNVEIRTEKNAVTGEETAVGYIEAPAASDEEVFVFAQKLEKACPAARMHGGVHWRHKETNTDVWEKEKWKPLVNEGEGRRENGEPSSGEATGFPESWQTRKERGRRRRGGQTRSFSDDHQTKPSSSDFEFPTGRK